LKTDALPAIWTDRKTFDADMAKLVAESTKLSAVAGTGNAATIGAQMKAVGATCGACHRQFRAED
jgi:cytochrome c556